MKEQYYAVTFDRNGINTSLISKEKAEQLIRIGFPTVKNQQELDLLAQEYEDPVVDRGSRYYRELNTLFTGVMVLLNEETPVVITTRLQKKERI